jgi:sulfite exporter TauE/SafE
MYSREHFVVGSVVSGLSVAALRGTFGLPALAALFAYGVFLSVFIDLDHFVVARRHAGEWSHLRACVRDPVFAFTRQDEVFEGIPEIQIRLERLLSHALIGGTLTAALAVLSVPVAVFTAVVVYAHVVADLLRDAGFA